jgi:hypothetical protein
MSAFIVEDITINRVVSRVAASDSFSNVLGKLCNLGFTGANWQSNLGQALFDLNVRSVEQRYGEGSAKDFRELNYKYHAMDTGKVQAYKSLVCLLYQSCEGDCDQEPLYKTMEQFSNELAAKIVRQLPAYDQAVWG